MRLMTDQSSHGTTRETSILEERSMSLYCIDPSTTRIGWAVFDRDGLLLDFGAVAATGP